MVDEKTREDVEKSGAYVPKTGVGQFIMSVGRPITGLFRGIGQGLGLVSEKEVIQERKYDEVLSEAGGAAATVGKVVGNIAMVAPAAFIPGVNGVVGATVLGAAEGAAQDVVESEGESRTKNAAVGAATGFGVAKLALLAKALPKTPSIIKNLWNEKEIVGSTQRSFKGKIEALADADNVRGMERAFAQARRKGINEFDKDALLTSTNANVSDAFKKRVKDAYDAGTSTNPLTNWWEKKVASWFHEVGTRRTGYTGAVAGEALSKGWTLTKWVGLPVAGLAAAQPKLAVGALAVLHKETDGKSTEMITDAGIATTKFVQENAPKALNAAGDMIAATADAIGNERLEAIAESTKVLGKKIKDNAPEVAQGVANYFTSVATESAPDMFKKVEKKISPDTHFAESAEGLIKGGVEEIKKNPLLLTPDGRKFDAVKNAAKTALNAATNGAANAVAATSTSSQTQEQENDGQSGGWLSNIFGMATQGGATVKNKIKTAFNMLGATQIGKWMEQDNSMGRLGLAMTASFIVGKFTNPLFGLIAFIGALTEGPKALEKMMHMIGDATPPLADNKATPTNKPLEPIMAG